MAFLKMAALLRFRWRRARLLLALGGVALSGVLLDGAVQPLWFFGADYQFHDANPADAYFSFLVLNPPATAIHLIAGPVPSIQLVASVLWWTSLAVWLRRRRARPLDAAVV